MKCVKCRKEIIEKYKGNTFCSKECYSLYLKDWRNKNNNYHREWKDRNPNYMKEWWINHQGYLREWLAENDFANTYKERLDVQKLAFKLIKIPKDYKCELCKTELATQRHHEDYSKPLQVILCCKKCHGLLDEARHKKEEMEIECGIQT